MPEPKPPPYQAENPSAEQVTARYQPSPEAKALLKPGMSPVQYSKSLMRNGQHQDNIAFMSNALPPRQGVRWASRNMQRSGFQWSPEENQALQGAHNWATRPGGRTYRVMRSRMTNVSQSSPVGMIGQAGFYANSMGPQFGYGGLSGYGMPAGMTPHLNYRTRWQSRDPSDIRFDSALNRMFGDTSDRNAPDPTSFMYRDDPDRYWSDMRDYRDRIAQDLRRGRGGAITDDNGNIVAGRGRTMNHEDANLMADRIVNQDTNGEFGRRGNNTFDTDRSMGGGSVMGGIMTGMGMGGDAGMGYGAMGMGGMGYPGMGGFGMGGMGGMGMMSPMASCATLLTTAIIGTAALVMLTRSRRARVRTYQTTGISGIHHYNNRQEVATDTSMESYTSGSPSPSAPPPSEDGSGAPPSYQDSEGLPESPVSMVDKPPLPEEDGIESPPRYSEAAPPNNQHGDPPPPYPSDNTDNQQQLVETGFESNSNHSTTPANPDAPLIDLETNQSSSCDERTSTDDEQGESNDISTDGTL